MGIMSIIARELCLKL